MYSVERGQSIKNACQNGDIDKLTAAISEIKNSGEVSDYLNDLKDEFHQAIKNIQPEVVDKLLELEEVKVIAIRDYESALEMAKDKKDDLEYEDDLENKEELQDRIQLIIERLIKEPLIKQHENDKLLAAINNEDEYEVEELLQKLSDDLVLGTDVAGMNAIQLAVEKKNSEVLKSIVADERFKAVINHQDIYGRTAFDIARDNNFEEGIELLESLSVEVATKNVTKLNNLSQEYINDKLTHYLNQQGRAGESIIDSGGNCNGWAFIYLIHASKGSEEEFFKILNIISTWDGSPESLKNTELPPELKSKYQNLQELLEQTCNDLAIFHFVSDATKELNLDGWGQKSRNEQYELVRDPINGRELRNLFNFTGTVSRTQLIEMLEHFSRWPDTAVDVGGGRHATSFYVKPDGKFSYYDPNHFNQVAEFSSAAALADHLIAFKYKQLGSLNNDHTVDIVLRSNKFYPKLSTIPDVEKPSTESKATGANKFSDLHWAVLENDIEAVKKILSKNPEAINEKNAHGSTPIHLAIQNEQAGNQMVKLLLQTPGINVNQANNVGRTPLMLAIAAGNKDTLITLLETKEMDINGKDKFNANALFHVLAINNKETITLLLDHDIDTTALNKYGETPLIYVVKTGRLADLQTLLTHPKSQFNLNAVDYEFGYTALMSAVKNQNVAMVETLLKAGADPNFKNSYKESAFDLADSSPTILALLKQYQEKAALKLPEAVNPAPAIQTKSAKETKPEGISVERAQAATRARSIMFSSVRQTESFFKSSAPESILENANKQKPKR